MAGKTEKSAKDLANKSLYLERIPIIGRFFKAARQNVEGHGPGTNDMSTPASELPSAKAKRASEAMKSGNGRRAKDYLKGK